MNKKEQERFDEMARRAVLHRALRWSERPEIHPDIIVPTSGNFTNGYAFNAHAGRVEEAWSEATCHGYGRRYAHSDARRSATQGGIPLYSTKVLALRAMRCEMGMMYAQKLEMVDRQIAAEEATYSEATK